MSLPLKWEFPGGKIDPGESAEESLLREVVEELGVRVSVKKSLPSNTYNYPSFKITLYPFVCSIESGEIVLHEHLAITWRKPQDLKPLDWAEADVPVLRSYIFSKTKRFEKKRTPCAPVVARMDSERPLGETTTCCRRKTLKRPTLAKRV